LATVVAAAGLWQSPATCRAEGEWEVTPQSEAALARGLRWLAENQGPEGNWGSNDLGLVAMGALAFLADGHLPGRGRYGEVPQRAIDYILRNAQAGGLLNVAGSHRDMYNHGLATFVLGQAYGMSGDRRLGDALEKSLQLIVHTQCEDGGWDYVARPQARGHDLSLVVMQAKALRSAVDSGFEVPPEVIQLAIEGVRARYRPQHGRTSPESEAMKGPGQFTYNGHRVTVAMSAAGVVCLQEFGQYEDWRIPKNLEFISVNVQEQTKSEPRRNGRMAFDAYTMYYVGQALYQAGGQHWRQSYPRLRDQLVASQVHDAQDRSRDGHWEAGQHVSGKPGNLYGTSVACFILAIPNRYLPILQEGKIESIRQRFQ